MCVCVCVSDWLINWYIVCVCVCVMQVPMMHLMPFVYDLGMIQNTAAEVSMYLGIQLPYEFAQMTVVIGNTSYIHF